MKYLSSTLALALMVATGLDASGQSQPPEMTPGDLLQLKLVVKPDNADTVLYGHGPMLFNASITNVGNEPFSGTMKNVSLSIVSWNEEKPHAHDCVAPSKAEMGIALRWTVGLHLRSQSQSPFVPRTVVPGLNPNIVAYASLNVHDVAMAIEPGQTVTLYDAADLHCFYDSFQSGMYGIRADVQYSSDSEPTLHVVTSVPVDTFILQPYPAKVVTFGTKPNVPKHMASPKVRITSTPLGHARGIAVADRSDN